MKVERSDLEAKLAEIRDAVDEAADGARDAGILIALGIGLLVLLVYMRGRSRGRKGATLLEVYRLR